MNQITLLMRGAITFRKPCLLGPCTMLLLSAILRIALPSETPPNDLLARVRFRLGNLAFTVITLVYILVSFWQR